MFPEVLHRPPALTKVTGLNKYIKLDRCFWFLDNNVVLKVQTFNLVPAKLEFMDLIGC